MATIVGDAKFIETFGDWILKKAQTSANWLAKNKNGIPPKFREYADFLYIGMTISPEVLIDIQDNGMTFSTYTTWSKDLKVAKKSAMTRTGVNANAIRVVVKKKVPPKNQIIDIQGFVEFMGTQQLMTLGMDKRTSDLAINGAEVLCDVGLKITAKDLIFI